MAYQECMIVWDTGPQFTSQEFNSFVTSWGISLIISSPMHQLANGKAESEILADQDSQG